MRLKLYLSMLFVFGLALFAFTQPADTQIESIADYESWGWTSIVQQNDLITIATVPAIGARLMQYQLGEYASIYRNPAELGKTYTPQNDPFSRNFGGFKNWPAPQSVWNWPPPPTLDYGEYESEIRVDSPDSTVLFVRSPVEQWDAPGIQFERTCTLYKGTSRVRMDQTLINTNTTVKSWSMWDITQSISHHPSQTDFENFWVYFPLNPESAFGSDGVYWGSSWGEPTSLTYGEVAPGIFGMQYGPRQCKVFGDAPEGWICLADEGEGVVFAKTFEIWPEEVYPDNGGIVQTYFSGAGDTSNAYIEVEVTSPIIDLAADGGSYTFTEHFCAAKVSGPILGVNEVGAIGRSLDFDDATGNVVGRYGVFYDGTAQAVVLNSEGGVLAEGAVHDVTPIETFSLNEAIAIPEIAGARVAIQIKDYQGNPVGTLDEATVEEMSTVRNQRNQMPDRIELLHNYPNPFNGHTTIEFQLDKKQNIRLAIYDVSGREQAVLASDDFDAGSHLLNWDASALPGGVYFARIESQNFFQTMKMVYLP